MDREIEADSKKDLYKIIWIIREVLDFKFNSKQIINIQTKSSQTKALIIFILHDSIYKGKVVKRVKTCHFGMRKIPNYTRMRINICNKKLPWFPLSEQNF